MSNPFTLYGNTSTYIVTFVKPGLNSNHDIHSSYVTSNTYFVTFLIPGVHTFVMPSVKSIYELTFYNKFTYILSNLINSLFMSKL